MKKDENRDVGRRHASRLPRKRYERPHLTVHGTVESLTRGAFTGDQEATIFSSVE